MAGILEPDERKIAQQALKLSYLSNRMRSLDKKYVEAIRAMDPD